MTGVRKQVFGKLAMRVLPLPKKGFDVSMLHESLPSFSDTPAIVHKRTQEFVLVLSGRVDAYLDGRRLPLKKGDMFQIPAGVGHRFETGGRGMTALSLFSPPLDADTPDVYPVTSSGTGKRYDSPFKKRDPK